MSETTPATDPSDAGGGFIAPVTAPVTGGVMRERRLDVLRFVAVLLVMLRHSQLPFTWASAGWMGVDLFFVLSGFLISGLFFSEYKRTGTIRFKRFFIRRALKIYPAFYFFLLATGLVSYFGLHTLKPAANYLREALFVMNYGPSVWDYTWSLAVEEHFYLLLPAFLAVLMRVSKIGSMFAALPVAFAVLAVLCLVGRCASVLGEQPDYYRAYASSHTRLDALFCGVVISYLHHHRRDWLRRHLSRWSWRLGVLAASAACLSTALIFPVHEAFMSTIGLSLTFLGFGGVLLLTLYVRDVLPAKAAALTGAVGGALAYVGTFSYSIYLWHGPAGSWLPGLVRRVFRVSLDTPARVAVYLAGSLIIGIVASKIVEYPVLRLRDRFFPAGAAKQDLVTTVPARMGMDAALEPSPRG